MTHDDVRASVARGLDTVQPRANHHKRLSGTVRGCEGEGRAGVQSRVRIAPLDDEPLLLTSGDFDNPEEASPPADG